MWRWLLMLVRRCPRTKLVTHKTQILRRLLPTPQKVIVTSLLLLLQLVLLKIIIIMIETRHAARDVDHIRGRSLVAKVLIIPRRANRRFQRFWVRSLLPTWTTLERNRCLRDVVELLLMMKLWRVVAHFPCRVGHLSVVLVKRFVTKWRRHPVIDFAPFSDWIWCLLPGLLFLMSYVRVLHVHHFISLLLLLHENHLWSFRFGEHIVDRDDALRSWALADVEDCGVWLDPDPPTEFGEEAVVFGRHLMLLQYWNVVRVRVGCNLLGSSSRRHLRVAWACWRWTTSKGCTKWYSFLSMSSVGSYPIRWEVLEHQAFVNFCCMMTMKWGELPSVEEEKREIHARPEHERVLGHPDLGNGRVRQSVTNGDKTNVLKLVVLGVGPFWLLELQVAGKVYYLAKKCYLLFKDRCKWFTRTSGDRDIAFFQLARDSDNENPAMVLVQGKGEMCFLCFYFYFRAWNFKFMAVFGVTVPCGPVSLNQPDVLEECTSCEVRSCARTLSLPSGLLVEGCDSGKRALTRPRASRPNHLGGCNRRDCCPCTRTEIGPSACWLFRWCRWFFHRVRRPIWTHPKSEIVEFFYIPCEE